MLSFKSLVLSLAVVALSSSTVSAKPLSSNEGLEHLSRRMTIGANMLGERDLVAPGAVFAKRESRKEAAARVRLAKNRAARKAKRAAAAAISPVVDKRAVTAFVPNAAGVQAFASYSGTRCGTSKACKNAANKASLPTNGTPYCDPSSRTCTIICEPGYLLQSDGTCLATAAGCGTINNGIYVISGGNCVVECQAGYQFYNINGTPQCLNNQINSNFCGSPPVVCAASYNNVGTTQCRNGQCSLRCPGGTHYATTLSGKPMCVGSGRK